VIVLAVAIAVVAVAMTVVVTTVSSSLFGVASAAFLLLLFGTVSSVLLGMTRRFRLRPNALTPYSSCQQHTEASKRDR